MPIPWHIRKQFYGRKWRTETRPRILGRERDCCKFCGGPNHVTVIRDGGGWWNPATNHWFHPQGLRPEQWTNRRVVRIVLTVAHLNHICGADRDENLAALCQYCHLNFDKQHHEETRCQHKDERRPLLQPLPQQEMALCA